MIYNNKTIRQNKDFDQFVVILDALDVDCAVTDAQIGLFLGLHPLGRPSEQADWHRRPDMQISSFH